MKQELLRRSLRVATGLLLLSAVLPRQSWSQTVTSVDPSAANAGTPGVTLTINGQGFPTAANYTLIWSAGSVQSSLPASAASSTVVTSSIPGNLLAQPGSAGLTLIIKNVGGQQQAVGAGGFNVCSFQISTPSPLPAGTVGTSYTQALGVNGCVAVSQWSGAPPAGLSLNPSTGVIGGVPSTAGTFTFTAAVQDVNGASTSKSFSLTINPIPCNTPLQIMTTSLPNGTVGQSYSAGLSANGCAPLTWNGSVDGLTINSTTGVLSGTPAAAGNFTLNATVQDANGASISKSIPLTINPQPPGCTTPLQITTTSLPNGIVGQSYSAGLSANGCAPLTWSGSVDGLTVNPTTGVLSGTPTAPGTFTLNVTVQDANGASVSKSIPLTINPPPPGCPTPLQITTTSLPNGTVGQSYSAGLSANGCAPLTWSGSVDGLTLNPSTGVLSGTPTAAGNFTLNATVQDANGASVSKSIPLTINPPPPGCTTPLQIATTSLPNGTVGQSYSAGLSANGCAPLMWSGSVDGLTVNPTTGIVSGTPTAPGTFTLNATVQDANGASVSKSIPLTINPPPPGCDTPLQITTTSLPNGTVGQSYSAGLSANGCAPLTWSGSVDGLTINPSTGVLSGTPTAAGKFTLNATVQDANGASVSKSIPLTINPPPPGCTTPLQITTTSLPNGTVQQSYSVSLAATGCLPVRWSGSVDGLTIDPSTGVLSGTPTAAGTFTLLATVQDANTSSTTSLTITIDDIQDRGCVTPLQIITTSLPTGTVGKPYSATLAATGCSVFIWSGAIPGLTVNPSTGVLSGTPTTAGTFPLAATVQDGTSTVTKILTVEVKEPNPGCTVPVQITTLSLPDGILGEPYAAALSGTGCDSFRWAGTSLPGLTFDAATGVLSGRPSVAGSFFFNATLTDSKATVSKSYAFTISAVPFRFCNEPLSIKTVSLPNGTVGQAYAASLAAAGCTQLRWSGTPPAGLTLDPATGAITGTPSVSGDFVWTATAQDNKGAVSRQISLTIYAIACTTPLQIITTSLPDAIAGQPYSVSLEASGCNSFRWSGTMPAGLTLDPSTGIISGTPSTTGKFTPTITLQDSNTSVTKPLSLTINAPVGCTTSPQITTTTLPTGNVRRSYTATLTATGCAPFRWTGSAPPGLTIDPTTGVISGTPTTTGTLPFTATLQDSSGSVTKQLALTVYGIGPSALHFDGIYGVPLHVVQNITIATEDPGATYTASVSSSPDWLRVGRPGSGTPSLHSLSVVAPGIIQVGVDTSLLHPADGSQTTKTYDAVIHVGGGSDAIDIPVTLTMTTQPVKPFIYPGSFGGVLSLAGSLSFDITIANLGGCGTQAPPCFTWTATVDGEPPIVQLSQTEGTGDVVLTVTVLRENLGPRPPDGIYRFTITITINGQQIKVPGTIFVPPDGQPSINTPQDTYGVNFNGRGGGLQFGTIPVTDLGGASSTWTAEIQDAAPWLSLTTKTGTTNKDSVGYVIDPSKLPRTPGCYDARIVISATNPSTGATDSRTVIVRACVNARTDLRLIGYRAIRRDRTSERFNGVFVVDPDKKNNYAFIALDFDPNTFPLTVSLSTASEKARQSQRSGDVQPLLVALAVTEDATAWLGTCGTGDNASVVCALDMSSLASGGVYQANIYVQTGGTVQVFPLAIIVRNGTGATCTPTRLVLGELGLWGNFTLPVISGTNLTVFVYDNCGSSRQTGTVKATLETNIASKPPVCRFDLGKTGSTNPDDPLYYSAAVPNRCGNPSSAVLITVTATDSGLEGQLQFAGVDTGENATPSIVAVANAVQFPPAPLAAGDIISLWGTNLLSAPRTDASWPEILGDAQLWIGTQPVRLYSTQPGQLTPLRSLDPLDSIVAQIPAGMALNPRTQVIVRISGKYGVFSLPVFTAPTNPALLTFNDPQGGPSNSAILENTTNPGTTAQTIPDFLSAAGITPSSSAAPSDTIRLFATGLGIPCDSGAEVRFGGDGGAVAHATAACVPLSTPKGNEPRVQIYRLEIAIPADASTGPFVPVQVKGGDLWSAPAVTIPIQAAAQPSMMLRRR